MKEAGVALGPPRGRRVPAKPASQVDEVTTDLESAKPANEVTTDSDAAANRASIEPEPSRSPSASACEPFHELIEAGLSRYSSNADLPVSRAASRAKPVTHNDATT